MGIDFDPNLNLQKKTGVVLKTGKEIQGKCAGGLHICSIPIFSGNDLTGVLKYSFGDPPTNPRLVKSIADKYGVDFSKLIQICKNYSSRPPFIIKMARQRLEMSCRLIGEMLQRHQAEQEIKKKNDELTRLKEKAENANLAKTRFLANMSHDLRTPLNGILGMAHLMKLTKLNGEQKNHLDGILKSGMILNDILGDILDVSKIEVGKLSIKKQSFCPKTLFGDIINMIDSERNVSVQFKTSISRSFPKTLIGDATRLRQILINLLSNANKFTHEGHITLTARGRRKGDRYIASIIIEDTGIGIPEKKIQSIFDPFEQVDDKLTSNNSGVGLGLAIVHQLTLLMEGSISVQSNEGSGTRFSLTLPFWLRNDNLPKDNSTTSKRKPPPLQILLTEDNLINRQVMKKILMQSGHSVEVAENGQKAVAMCHQKRFDLILMDLQMPVMNGLDATKAIRKRKNGKNRKTIIIALTAYATEEDREACLRAGMDDFLTKPIVPQELSRTLSGFFCKQI